MKENHERSEELKDLIITRLKSVIDPETGADVIRMRLVEDLNVSTHGEVIYTFRPSSPLCPLASFIVQQIKETISDIPGVTSQQIRVTGFFDSDKLTKLINKENK
jgi:metal-sulfur cluster biosynthetic enzyme